MTTAENMLEASVAFIDFEPRVEDWTGGYPTERVPDVTYALRIAWADTMLSIHEGDPADLGGEG